ncbi:MAG: hypothetical protein LBM06_06595, partial [Prevotellaceae bacterium]|nr:hypothetical protein [Prevotellaceae bacterium]
MKRTTYMIAGLLLAGLMSICGTMLLLRFYSTPYNHQEELERLTIPLKGEPTAVGLPPCRV